MKKEYLFLSLLLFTITCVYAQNFIEHTEQRTINNLTYDYIVEFDSEQRNATNDGYIYNPRFISVRPMGGTNINFQLLNLENIMLKTALNQQGFVGGVRTQTAELEYLDLETEPAFLTIRTSLSLPDDDFISVVWRRGMNGPQITHDLPDILEVNSNDPADVLAQLFIDTGIMYSHIYETPGYVADANPALRVNPTGFVNYNEPAVLENGRTYYFSEGSAFHVEPAVVNINVLTTVGVERPDRDLEIYPNPSHGVVHVGFNGVIEGSVNVNIFNMSGGVVKSSEHQPEKLNSGQSFTIDLSSLPTGIYLMEIQLSDTIITKKIFKI